MQTTPSSELSLPSAGFSELRLPEPGMPKAGIPDSGSPEPNLVEKRPHSSDGRAVSQTAVETHAAVPSADLGGASFTDRRGAGQRAVGGERRQFASSHQGLSPAARELAMAIDSYKLEHRRRYVTFEEMLLVIQELGYRK